MSDTERTRGVYFLGNPNKPGTVADVEDLLSSLPPRCGVLGHDLGLDGRAAADAGAERIVVLGGDGTLIGVVRSLNSEQIPLSDSPMAWKKGRGKLGFLTEFSTSELKVNFERAVLDDTLIARRMMLHITVEQDGGVRDTSVAVNDCVIQAGPPFRMVDLDISINGQHLTTFTGDGLIVCTPCGSTAHNLSAGGPLIRPGIDAIVLTPLCPHSLTHRPLVVEREAVIEIHAQKVNPGTTAIIDGQVSCPLEPGGKVTVGRFGTDFMLVRNPLHARWHKLITKLHWGKAPNYE